MRTAERYFHRYEIATPESNHAMERTADRCMRRQKEKLIIKKRATRALWLLLFFVASAGLTQQPPARRPLTPAEAAALDECGRLAHRVLDAWSRYLEVTNRSTPIRGGVDVLTRTPTLELLHATHSLSDSDLALSLHYQTRLHPVPPNAPKDAPILSMRTDRGEIVVDISGNVTLQPLK